MQFQEGASIYSSDGEQIGKVDRVVIDPRSGEVTHLIIRRGIYFGEDKVLPVDLIEDTDKDKLSLGKSREEIGELPDFEEVHYVTPDRRELTRSGYQSSFDNPYYWYPPYAYAQFGYRGYPARTFIPSVSHRQLARVERNIPDGAIPLKEGASVYSADMDQVGKIDRLIIDPDSGQVTHLLLSSGILFKSRKLVPAIWINTVDEEKISLVVGSSLLEALPDYEDEQ